MCVLGEETAIIMHVHVHVHISFPTCSRLAQSTDLSSLGMASGMVVQ